MNRFILTVLTIVALPALSQNLSKRVIHNNPANYRQLTAVHAGAGQMKFTGLIGAQTLATNFLYLHAGEIPDKAGIGQHFHLVLPAISCDECSARISRACTRSATVCPRW